MKIAMCQLNPVTGDVRGNTRRMLEVVQKNGALSPDLYVFPELFLLGYPPLDLLERDWFIAQGLSALDDLCDFSRRNPAVGILTGVALPNHVPNGKGLFNSAVLITDGRILFHQNKSLLPTYDVFDESRYFDPAPEIDVVAFKGEKLGIAICEDAWNPLDMLQNPRYDFDPVAKLVELGATLLVNVSASPFYLGKRKRCIGLMQHHSKKHGVPLVYVNLVGANDELIFDGSSFFLDAGGALRLMLPSFRESVEIVDTAAPPAHGADPVEDTIADIYDALVLGVLDYTKKCGFKKAVVGLSGGIDSAVTAAVAADALGPANILGVTMPSQFSSKGSVDDSRKLAKNLGISLKKIPIKTPFNGLLRSLKPFLGDDKPGVTQENMQARIRGLILMAISNKTGSILLSTGNKSEVAVGYCTLYGDTCGGLAVISDLSKTKVYELARHINREKEIIPAAIIAKTPSAELKPDQKDSDTLGSYDVLDGILEQLVEKGISRQECVAKGFDAETVAWVYDTVAKNEYKRRQLPPGLKVTSKAFGSGRRFPIAAKYKQQAPPLDE